MTAAEIAQAKKLSVVIGQLNRLLREANVPFDASLLYSRNWRGKLRPHLSQIADMRETKYHKGGLKGVKMADVLHLPERVRVTGDTLIIVHDLVVSGRELTIKGPHGVHLFVLGSVRMPGGKGRVTIDTSGFGRDEWLQSRQQNTRAQNLKRRDQGRSRLAGGAVFMKASYGYEPAAAVAQSNDGQPGVDGYPGLYGANGSDGSPGYNGANGGCAGAADGQDGGAGSWGDPGNDGGNGGNGSDGGNAGPVTVTISDPNDQNTYSASAKGGRGGNGGPGGYGGRGGNGGQGGNGGNGASCGCFPGGVGNGGNGGDAGNGGSGGSGGSGGNGGRGGNGGTITINYPAGYDWGRVQTDVSGGPAGLAGEAGGGGQGGSGARGGTAGSGGSVFACFTGANGHAGQNGGDGGQGTHGSPGEHGANGDPGSVIPIQSGGDDGGGGGGDCCGGYEPGYYYGYCTEWWWVHYDCYYYASQNHLPAGEAIFQKVGLLTAPSPLRRRGWECYETYRTYAGCW